MARASSSLRDQLREEIGAPLDFDAVRNVFGGSGAAADALGLPRPARNRPADQKAEMINRRKTFQQSWSRWSRGTRRPTGGYWERLRSIGERREIIRQVRLYGLIVESFSGEVDVYGADIRDRQILEEVYIEPDDLEDAGGWNFYQAVERNDWTEAAKAVATAWFTNYIGNDLAGGDVALGEGDLIVRIPRPGRDS